MNGKIGAALLVGMAAGTLSAATLNAKSSYNGGWGSYTISLVQSLNGYTPAEGVSSDYTRTGACAYLRADSTGFYYVAKIDGRWWLIDPDGYAGINKAVTSLDAASLQDDYDVLRRNGFNGTGNFIASESQTKNSNNLWNYGQMSYTRRYNFYASYRQVRQNYYDTPEEVQNKAANYLLVLDPQFETFCQAQAKSNFAQYSNERDLLGYFTDNELPFNIKQLDLVVSSLSAGDPTYDSTVVWAARNGVDLSAPTEAQKEAYATYLAERYYSVVTKAIRAADLHHMILGSRLHGVPRSIQGVVDMSHKYCDVTSVNFYDYFCPNDQIAKAEWTNDHPCLVSEFYIKDVHYLAGVQEGAGWYVNSQADRGRWYQNTCLQLLQNPCFIGWQYFRFMDNNNSNKGLVTTAREEYSEMTRYVAELNTQVYRLIDFFDGTSRCPQDRIETECAFAAVADTYITPGAKQTDTHGTETELVVRYYGTESERREAFVRFDLSRAEALLPYLKQAELRLTCAATDGEAHNLLVSGVEDASWTESLTGAERAGNASWKSVYNRLAAEKKAFVADSTYSFDVTRWVLDHATAPSFKLHALTKTDGAVSFYSREGAAAASSQERAISPELVLRFFGRHRLPDGVEQAVMDESGMDEQRPATKIIEDGQVYILRAGTKYTLFGVPMPQKRFK